MGARGPKPWVPTAEEISKITLYSSTGCTQEQTATLIGKSVDTLVRNEDAKAAFELGKAQTIAKVGGSLVRRALAGGTAEAIFYLKTQAGWKETNVQEHIGNLTVTRRSEELPDDELAAIAQGGK